MISAAPPWGSTGAPRGATFDQMLAPLTRAEFLSQFWGRDRVCVPGAPDKFESLFSWAELSAIVVARPFDMERFKLYRDGKEIDASHYVQSTSLGPRIRYGSVLNFLADGATLIIDSVHAHAERLGALATSCEEVLGAETLVNVYASHKGNPGFNLHWDWQEAIVLQVQGRKRWKVFKPTKEHPLRQDGNQVPKPTGEPVWDGVLDQGCVLYLPRGWWHLAVPLDEPSLHLTVTSVPPTGLDFLNWVVTGMTRGANVRANAPMLATADERAEFVVRLREAALSSLSVSAVDDFLAQWRSSLTAAQHFNLPAAPLAVAPLLQADGETRLRLGSLAGITLVRGSESSWFYANGIRWDCPAGLEEVVESLDGNGTTVPELLARIPGEKLRQQLASLLGALQMAGVVVAER